MTTFRENVVSGAVQHDTCSGCGVCAGICPRHVLAMGLAANGDLVPHLVSDQCTGCGQCIEVCPFAEGVHDPRAVNEARFRTKAGQAEAAFEDDVGWHEYALVGYSPAFRPTSASGGLTTALLAELLSRGEVDAVGVVGQTAPSRGVQFSFQKVTSPEDLVRCSSSVYQPVEISEIARQIVREAPARWALVGVPCLCAAVRSAGSLDSLVPYVLGLACGMYQNAFYTEMLLAASGLDPSDTTRVEYRRKSSAGPANDFRFRGIDSRGPGREIPYHGLPWFLGSNGYFRVNACNYCRDVFAEAADACFMDAWLPEYRSDLEGMSLVLVRNARLGSVLESSARCRVQRVPVQQVVQSQRGHVRRKRELVAFRQGLPGGVPRRMERLQWRLQRATQRRSKRAWAQWGRTYGLAAFWFAMFDLVALQCMLELLVKSFRRLARGVASSRRALHWRLG